MWFSLTIHFSLSVSEVSYKPPHLSSQISFSFFFNFFIIIFCMWNLLWLNISALTLVQQAQQQQQQQLSSCKCCTNMCLWADNLYSFCLVQHLHCCFCSCRCWCQFCSWGWSTAACFVHSLLSDNDHSCSAQWQHFVHTDLYHITADENSSAVVHQCDSDSESECVDFWQLYQLSEMWYDVLFKMLLYIKTFQWVLQQLQVMWSCCSLLYMQQWCTHYHLK